MRLEIEGKARQEGKKRKMFVRKGGEWERRLPGNTDMHIKTKRVGPVKKCG